MTNIGRIAMGIYTPIIREGDDLANIVIQSLPELQNGDIIGITESVVARAQGNYVTVDEVAQEIEKYFGKNANIAVLKPIYSRNRFAIILKGIARAAKRIIMLAPDYDEVGNPSGVNQFTGCDILKYYKQLCKDEDCEFKSYRRFIDVLGEFEPHECLNALYCGLHDYFRNPYKEYSDKYITLANICSNKCKYGLLGSNKATEEKLKLFPDSEKSQKLVDSIQAYYKNLGIDIECMVYGDGCFKDPVGGIWEFADPVTSPAYTSGLVGTPNELKLKALADDKFQNLNGDELSQAIKSEILQKQGSLKGKMSSQGTTPRRWIDLLASFMDLTSGSGDAGTPIVLIRNYKKNYSDVC